MKLADILALVGVIIGLPAFLALFLSGKWIEAVLVMVLLAFLLGMLWYFGLPEFTVIRLEKILTIHDRSGRHATLVRRARMRPNQKGLGEWWCRNIGGDGEIRNVLIDSQRPSEQDNRGGLISVCKRYQHPLPRWKVFETTVSCEMAHSYTQTQESLIHTVAYMTRELAVTVEFPAERPVRSAQGVITFSGEQRKRVGDVNISEGGRRAELRVQKPKIGAQYHLEWEW